MLFRSYCLFGSGSAGLGIARRKAEARGRQRTVAGDGDARRPSTRDIGERCDERRLRQRRMDRADKYSHSSRHMRVLSWLEKLGLDGVQQRGRLNDIHLGRLDGDECGSPCRCRAALHLAKYIARPQPARTACRFAKRVAARGSGSSARPSLHRQARSRGASAHPGAVPADRRSRIGGTSRKAAKALNCYQNNSC